MNENTQILKAIQGNQEAFAALFSRYRPLLYSLAHGVLHNAEYAEDAGRGCLRGASRNLPTFKSEGSLRAWLVRVLINEAASSLRKRRSRLTIVLGPGQETA
jgi:RNA polymerase sigma-70 factor (ECF subfamily)